MQVTTTLIELNARRGDVIRLNGMTVEVDKIDFVGTEKQIAWADQIARKAIRLSLEEIYRRAAGNGLLDTAGYAKLEATLKAACDELAKRVDGKPASVWIDNRDRLPVAIIRAVAAS